MKQVVIFDFDGTIANSFDYVTDFLRLAAGVDHELSRQEKQALKHLAMQDVALKLGIAPWRLLFLFWKGRKLMGAHIQDVPLIPGMQELIVALHDGGFDLFIMTSNNARNVRKFLRHHQLNRYFRRIYGNVGVLGKKTALKYMLRTKHLQASQCTYIGDEPRDVRAAQKVNVRAVAVTWGFAESADLQTLRPAALVRTPAELKDFLEKLPSAILKANN